MIMSGDLFFGGGEGNQILLSEYFDIDLHDIAENIRISGTG